MRQFKINQCRSNNIRSSYYAITSLRRELNHLSNAEFLNYICAERNDNDIQEIKLLLDFGYCDQSKFTHSPYDHILEIKKENHTISTVYIPKNGCTMVKKIFLQLANVDIEGIYPGSYHPKAEGLLRKKYFTNPEKNELHFVIIRHPVDRFWSALLDKFIAKPEPPIIKQFAKMSGAYDTTTEDYSDLFNLTLKNFVDLVFGTPDNMLDKHFCSQSSFLPSRMVDSTLLIPLEKLSAFAEYIGNKYNIDINVNDSPHKTSYSATDCETLQITESTTLNAIKTHYEKHRNLPRSKELPPELINSLNIRFKQDVNVFRSSIIQSRILPATG